MGSGRMRSLLRSSTAIATLIELPLNRWQVGRQQQRLLMRSQRLDRPQQHERRTRLASMCQQRTEVGVFGDDDAILRDRSIQDLGVGRVA